MKIALLFDAASALGPSADVLILETVEAVEHVLAGEGNQVVRVPVNTDGRWVERFRRGKFDVAFNLCESIDAVASTEPAVISVLEVFGIPYTGSSSWTTALCLRKHVVNAMLERDGLPIPRFGVVRPGERPPTVGFPAICKPAAEDASIGVEQRSVVRTMRALGARLQAMHERWDEVVVQRFIDGREVNVGILGDETLPVAEIHFGEMPKKMWRIVSYRSKWIPGCEEDTGAQPECPADLPRELTAELSRLALAAWRVVGGLGYGRVDFRIDSSGRPWLLEVNANPDVAPDAGLARMARVAGLDYGALVRTICEHALARREAPSTAERWVMASLLSGMPPTVSSDALDLFAVGQQ
ncbi:MAG: D-alanine--D-alanine ligase family protein [Gemmatimonadaceae bacterium]